MIVNVKCFTKFSVDNICLKIIFKSVYYEVSKLKKVSGCWSAFHKTGLIWWQNWPTNVLPMRGVITFLKSLGIADNLEIPLYFLASNLYLFYIWGHCEDSRNGLVQGFRTESDHTARDCVGTWKIDRLNKLKIVYQWAFVYTEAKN